VRRQSDLSAVASAKAEAATALSAARGVHGRQTLAEPKRCRAPLATALQGGLPETARQTLSLALAHTLRRSLWLVLCLAAPLSEGAEAARLEGLFGHWLAVQTNLQSWSADFTQTRSLKVLAEPLVATGKVWVAPGRFRWELGQPAQTIVVRQPDQLVIIYPRLKRAEKYPLSGVPPGPARDALALLDASLPRDRASLEEHFGLLSAAETNSTLQVMLQPKSASARKFISDILIGFHTNDFAIAVTEMRFADGSSLRNDFANVLLNPPIDPARFQAELMPDFTVVEPLHR
jgi:outer membrane lipoprotein-sorting protein